MPVIVQILVLLGFITFGLTMYRKFSKSRWLNLISAVSCMFSAFLLFGSCPHALIVTILMLVLLSMAIFQFVRFGQ